MARISQLLGKTAETLSFDAEARAAKAEFHREYVTASGRIVSDTQAAYALAICFGILTPSQRDRASERLVY